MHKFLFGNALTFPICITFRLTWRVRKYFITFFLRSFHISWIQWRKKSPDKSNYLTVNWLIGVTRKIFARSSTARGCTSQSQLKYARAHNNGGPAAVSQCWGSLPECLKCHRIQWNGQRNVTIRFLFIENNRKSAAIFTGQESSCARADGGLVIFDVIMKFPKLGQLLLEVSWSLI